MRNFRDYAVLTLKGLGMGASDIIPGVSGGTIALLQEFMKSLLILLNLLILRRLDFFFTFALMIFGNT
jgi:putative membrane protein